MEKYLKKELGAFYTTNVKKIFELITIPNNFDRYIDPFCGNKDLLKYINHLYPEKITLGYDINSSVNPDIVQNSIITKLNFSENDYLITNPPYLLKNKSSNTEDYLTYGYSDLYKNSFANIINSNSKNGLLIIPSNFLFDEDINFRKYIFSKINVYEVNIFNFSVFNDTDIRICILKYTEGKTNRLNINIFSEYNILTKVNLSDSVDNRFLKIGRDFFSKIDLEKNQFSVRKPDQISRTELFLKTIDSSKGLDLGFFYSKELSKSYSPKISDRNIIQLNEDPGIEIVNKTNEFLIQMRIKYHDLFLTNFLGTSSSNRKRIPIKLANSLLSWFSNN